MAVKLTKAWLGFQPGHVLRDEVTDGVQNLLVERLQVGQWFDDNGITTDDGDGSKPRARNAKGSKKTTRASGQRKRSRRSAD